MLGFTIQCSNGSHWLASPVCLPVQPACPRTEVTGKLSWLHLWVEEASLAEEFLILLNKSVDLGLCGIVQHVNRHCGSERRRRRRCQLRIRLLGVDVTTMALARLPEKLNGIARVEFVVIVVIHKQVFVLLADVTVHCRLAPDAV